MATATTFDGLQLGPNAIPVLESRYLDRDDTGEIIETPPELFRRVARHVASARRAWGATEGDLEEVENRYYQMMTSGRFLPNSPTLMNAGRKLGMLSACFVLPLEDSIEDIMQTATDIALVQRAGGGTGIDLSRLRPNGSIVSSSGGTTAGPLSFLQMFSAVTTSIQQGAFRRGANMGVMRVDHPDIVAFIDLKSDLSQVTNYNLSVAVTDEFMTRLRESPDEPHVVHNPHTGASGTLDADGQAHYEGNGRPKQLTVRKLWERITERAWACGEPGLIFIDEVNRHNATPHVGAMRATNPCGEQPLLANEGCNLASINLAAFYDSGRIDFEPLDETVRLGVQFLDDVVEVNNYPTPAIHDACHANRRIGLGVMGFADLLYGLRIPYDSQGALDLAMKLGARIQTVAHDESEELATVRGEFPSWEGSTWNGEMRNAQVTTIAPTGTISIIAGCSGGIEPLFSLAFVRQVLDGETLQELNPIFEQQLRQQVKEPAAIERILAYAAEHGSIQGCSEAPAELRTVFRTARDVSPEWHVRMQAAWQTHTDAAVSKTINLPVDAAARDVEKAYLVAHELGCKGITVYRDGCRAMQPMALATETTPTEAETVTPVHLPDLMPSVRIKQRSPLGNLHAQVSIDAAAGREREVFAQLGKAGELACADLEAICRLISMLLRVGVPLTSIVEQLDGIGSSLSLPSKEGRVMSLPDALARALGKYLAAKDASGLESLLLGTAQLGEHSNGRSNDHSGSPYKLKCPDCGGTLVFEEACAKCYSCGFSQC